MQEKVYRGADDRDEPPVTLDSIERNRQKKRKKQRRRARPCITRCPNCVTRLAYDVNVDPDDAIYDHIWTGECPVENEVPHLNRTVEREDAREKRMANA